MRTSVTNAFRGGEEVSRVSLLYSAVIRSVGPNDLLDKTLASLRHQTVPPAEILVVLPEDTNAREVFIPGVCFVQAERGMVSQRAAGIRLANFDMLLLDDDVYLEPTAAELLMTPVSEGRADCVVPYWSAYSKKTRVGRLVDRVFGLRVSKNTGGLSFTLGGGFYVPSAPTIKGASTEAGPGLAIALARSFSERTGVIGDMELQKVNPFAYLEDAALVFQVTRAGGRTLMIPGVGFRHLEGTTRTQDQRPRWTFEAMVHNHYLFWRKYLHVRHRGLLRLASIASVLWALIGIVFWAVVSCLRAQSCQPLVGTYLGLRSLLSPK